MQAISVIPSRREVRFVDHPASPLSQDHQVRVRTLEVGVGGTDKEICSFWTERAEP